MSADLKEAYGNYLIPKEILQLIQLEENLNKEDLSLSMIGCIPATELSPYSITPPDLIPFAETGGDGIHFGFLTDFHKVGDVMEAAIVCISPTNAPPVRYLANNFYEFISLVCSVPHVELLEQLATISNKEQEKAILEEYMSELPSSWKIKQEKVFSALKGIYPEGKKVDIIATISAAKEKRMEKIVIETFDGLGVVGETGGKRYEFLESRISDSKELLRMHQFLQEATLEEKQAFIRDIQYWYIVDPDYNYEIWSLVQDVIRTFNK
ncbi:SMI1/KNR4 family protein [Psychrobacillus sp. MER TA 171]|uniref:SMI1/KNR4 family protein n=1 Tax=Psychrobacillus sp. MER TA 171 TaxID=2939577 RepID=UPI00203F8111|nr:SMI1/KNR4 family protein [Psychrobacillus sp. MER TA 171]MCM3357972.1 SMI1/KNR4 family protein [Psychrobacillus sp. MER TA 171]